MFQVLLACDAGDRRDALLRTLKAAGFQVTATTHGADAVKLARDSHAAALLVVDTPACDALAMVKSVRAEPSLHACMALALASRDRHAALMQEGLDQALETDAAADQAVAAVRARLARRSQMLEVAGPDARRRSAESMVQSMAQAGTLGAVIALRIERLEQASAALGPRGAGLLREAVREALADALPAGGELALLDHGAVAAVAGADAAPEAATALLAASRRPVRVEGREMRLRGHAGWVASPGADADAATLIRRADSAAREARHQASGEPVAWTDALGARLLGDLELGSAMRRAVELAQFRLVFQPQLRMDRGDPIGVEALIRWNLPDGVSVPPGRFVALAEESGLIDEIGTWSLRQACREAVALEETGLSLRMAVNVTPRQASHPRFVESVRQALAESGLSGPRLVLELGEQMLLQDRDALLETLQAIRSLGVELCLDNYGSGFTSLDSLRRYPVNEIKLSRDLVQPLPGTASDRATIQAMLTMAQAMGLRATAVGVENAAQWAWLKEQGCDAAQGWLIGKPVEAGEVPASIAGLRRLRGKFAESVAD